MISIKSSAAFSWAGALSGIAASLCCITPVIALLAGSSSIAASFSWIVPARPYLIGVSIAVLSFAWYLTLKPVKPTDAGCDCTTTRKKHSFLQSKMFLSIVTGFSLLMIAFPLYAKMFYPAPKIQTIVVADDTRQQVKFRIQGMSCEACEAAVNNEIAKLTGVLAYQTSYANHTSLVSFDTSKVDLKAIETAISNTGYKVAGYDYINVPVKKTGKEK